MVEPMTLARRPIQLVVALGGETLLIWMLSRSGFVTGEPIWRTVAWTIFVALPFPLFLLVRGSPFIAAIALVAALAWGHAIWSDDPDGLGAAMIPVVAAIAYVIVIVSWTFNAWKWASEDRSPV